MELIEQSIVSTILQLPSRGSGLIYKPPHALLLAYDESNVTQINLRHSHCSTAEDVG